MHHYSLQLLQADCSGFSSTGKTWLSRWLTSTNSSSSLSPEPSELQGVSRLQQTQMGQLWAAATTRASFISKCTKMPQTSSSHFLSTPSKASTSAGRAAARGGSRAAGKKWGATSLNFSFHLFISSAAALCRKIIFCINKFIKLTYSRMEITGIT